MVYSFSRLADELVALAAGRPEAIDRAVRAQIYALDGTQPVTDDKPLETALGRYVYARPRFNLFLFAIFAGLGLVLALFGIYGVISTAVAQQTREIGIRMALGATFAQVTGTVLRSGLRLLALGVGVGLAGSLASAQSALGAGAQRVHLRPDFVRRGGRAAIRGGSVCELLAGATGGARGSGDGAAGRIGHRSEPAPTRPADRIRDDAGIDGGRDLSRMVNRSWMVSRNNISTVAAHRPATHRQHTR